LEAEIVDEAAILQSLNGLGDVAPVCKS
jgi:hypothetical protein